MASAITTRGLKADSLLFFSTMSNVACAQTKLKLWLTNQSLVIVCTQAMSNGAGKLIKEVDSPRASSL